MAVIQTIRGQEAFLAQVNGDYNIPFTEAICTVAGALPAGTILATLGSVAVTGDTAVVGILSKDKPAGTQAVRLMVRGNPSTVWAKELDRVAGYSVAASAYAAQLADDGIILI